MKQFSTLILIMVCCISSAQYSSITTDKMDEAMNQKKEFILLDEETEYTLSRTPVKYEEGKEMPRCYFTTLPVTATGLATVSDKRIMQIIDASTSNNDETYCAMYSKKEDKLIFGRRKFALKSPDAIWWPIVDGNTVIFCTLSGATNLSWGKFIYVDKAGQLQYSTSMSQASRWKIISAQ